MWLNCKVIKKWPINPPFSYFSPFLAKNFDNIVIKFSREYIMINFEVSKDTCNKFSLIQVCLNVSIINKNVLIAEQFSRQPNWRSLTQLLSYKNRVQIKWILKWVTNFIFLLSLSPCMLKILIHFKTSSFKLLFEKYSCCLVILSCTL